MAYERLEPFGPAAINLNTGKVASILMNVHSKKGVHFRPQDVALGDFGKPIVQQSVEDQKFMLECMVRAFGGRVVIKRNG